MQKRPKCIRTGPDDPTLSTHSTHGNSCILWCYITITGHTRHQSQDKHLRSSSLCSELLVFSCERIRPDLTMSSVSVWCSKLQLFKGAVRKNWPLMNSQQIVGQLSPELLTAASWTLFMTVLLGHKRPEEPGSCSNTYISSEWKKNAGVLQRQ